MAKMKRKKSLVGWIMPSEINNQTKWFFWKNGFLKSDIEIWKLKRYPNYKQVKITIEEI